MSKTRIEPVGKPDREVVLLSWNEMFRMYTYRNDLWNVLKSVCKYSKIHIAEGSVMIFVRGGGAVVTLWLGPFK